MLHTELHRVLSQTMDEHARLALLLIQLDRIQEVHEALGRRSSLELLRRVEARCSPLLQFPHTLKPLSCGEYALIIPGAGPDFAESVAAGLLRVFESSFDVQGAAVELGGHIGAAIFPDHGQDADTLLRHADVAASVAKRSDSSYAVYVADGQRLFQGQIALAAELRHAIEQSQLVIHYQPQVEVRSGTLTAVEALVRWDHPLHGLLPPADFIPLAEQARLIGPLSMFVMRAALEQCRAWHERGLDVRVAVNLSVHDFRHVRLADDVADLLARLGVSARQLSLEITESALLADPLQAREVLTRLRALGVRIAIDDFGTGYSSLAYLKDLPLDELKIDRSFVKDMAHDTGARAIVRSVIDLAHELGLIAIAEGVEDRATQEVLASLGCDLAQGYFFSPPCAAEDLADWSHGGKNWGLGEAERSAADANRRERSRIRKARLRAEEEFLARKRAEDALRDSEERYRAVVDNIKDVIFKVDEKGCWAFLNRAWQDITGFTCEETLGRFCLDYIHPEDQQLPRDALAPGVAEPEKRQRFELRFRTRTGEYRWVEAIASVLAAGDTIVGAYGTLSDITDRKQAEQHQRALEQSEKLRALGQMASGVAHDLNQSLGLIAGYGSMALAAMDQQQPDLHAVREGLVITTQAALDGGQTVRRLLTFAGARAEGEPDRLDAAVLLREVATLTAPRWRDGAQAEGRPIQLRIEAEPDLFVCGRAGDLREAFTNLVFNAIDAMPTGGEIRLMARRDGHRIVISVSDTGIGMTPEVQTHIFEPFFSTKGERGTGLGLSQVFGIVEHHAGEITLDSELARGSIFRVSFPAALPWAPTMSGSSHQAETGPRQRLRVLAVDDEPLMGQMIRRILRRDGHVVVTATSGEEALELLGTEVFDVVISDIGMGPRMNGWELAAEVRRQRPALAVVLATGWGATIDPEEARVKGIHAVLAKPYQPVDLQRILARIAVSAAYSEAA